MTKLFSGKQAQLPSTLNLGDLFYANDTKRTWLGSLANTPVEINATTVVLPAPDGTLPVSGADGADGASGSTGDTGPQGIQGAQGEQGIQGLPGQSINPRGDWDSVFNYQRGDLVSYDGSSYVALVQNSNNPPAGSEFWMLAADGGSAVLTVFGRTGNVIAEESDYQ